MKGMVDIELKRIEEAIIPIYENELKERLINARELHKILKNKRQFANWIKQRIQQYSFIKIRNISDLTILLKGMKKDMVIRHKLITI